MASGSRLHAGVFGPGDSGKTTLVKSLSFDIWQRAGIPSLVLDPNLDPDWGKHAFVTNDEELYMRMFWKNTRCFCVIEEAAETIKRDNEKNSIFTRGRHQYHKICVVGHMGTNLLPQHRTQLATLFLFRQPPSSAKIWAELFAEEKILACQHLKRFEFLHCEMYQEPRKKVLALR
jgi:hypothetical protein